MGSFSDNRIKSSTSRHKKESHLEYNDRRNEILGQTKVDEMKL